jgi:hypothetical protein
MDHRDDEIEAKRLLDPFPRCVRTDDHERPDPIRLTQEPPRGAIRGELQHRALSAVHGSIDHERCPALCLGPGVQVRLDLDLLARAEPGAPRQVEIDVSRALHVAQELAQLLGDARDLEEPAPEREQVGGATREIRPVAVRQRALHHDADRSVSAGRLARGLELRERRIRALGRVRQGAKERPRPHGACPRGREPVDPARIGGDPPIDLQARLAEDGRDPLLRRQALQGLGRLFRLHGNGSTPSDVHR